MRRRFLSVVLLLLIFIIPFGARVGSAASVGSENMIRVKPYIDQALDKAKTDLVSSKKAYDQFHDQWFGIEDTIKADSKMAYRDIENQMGQVEYAFMSNKQLDAQTALQNLQQVTDRYIQGQYTKSTDVKSTNVKTADVQSIDTRNNDTKSTNVQSTDIKGTDVKETNTKSTDTKGGEVKAAEVKSTDTKSNDLEEKDVTLSEFIILLQQTKESVQSQNQAESFAAIEKVRETWLSVEGFVVAQSASVYSDSERDMVVVNAMIADQNYEAAVKLLDTMIAYLSPLAQKSSYTFWDAAMIPLREGLEALLVVGALLAFVNKSKDSKAKRWVWAGVILGLIVSGILAVIIKVVFSSGAFGRNNFLISGWTGVFASVMLLYMSYWLHSNSNTEQWNRFIKEKTETALSNGRILSLGVLSFLAVFREGTETVLFIIGMINQISTEQLVFGILVGCGILIVIAYLMLFVGVKLPIRPFFLVSSVIVFYLCVKFMGLGIHGLQLAGLIPVSNSVRLPTIDFIGFYPSWQSAVPQFVIALSAVAFLIGSEMCKKKAKTSSGKY